MCVLFLLVFLIVILKRTVEYRKVKTIFIEINNFFYKKNIGNLGKAKPIVSHGSMKHQNHPHHPPNLFSFIWTQVTQHKFPSSDDP